MNESMDRDFLSASPSEATIYTVFGTDEMVEIAGRVPGVDAVEGRSIDSGNIIQSGWKVSFDPVYSHRGSQRPDT